MTDGANAYLEEIARLLARVRGEELAAIQAAAARVANAIADNHLIYVFGTGHSHLLAEEVFYRAGGLLAVCPILETGLMLHENAPKSTLLERLEGYAALLLDAYDVARDDVLVVVSNSGLNALPVEMAMEGKRRGAFVMAITSLSHSRSAPARHSSRRKLYELVDLVLDNYGHPGDAAIPIPGHQQRVGPTSTVIGAAILNAVMAEAACRLAASGIEPPVMESLNLPGSEDRNRRWLEHYRPRIRSL